MLAKCTVLLLNYHLFLLLEFNFYLNLVEDLCVIYVCMWLESSLNFNLKISIEWSECSYFVVPIFYDFILVSKERKLH